MTVYLASVLDTFRKTGRKYFFAVFMDKFFIYKSLRKRRKRSMKFLKFKRLAAAALAATMVFSLAACGTPGEPEKSEEEGSAKTEAPAEGSEEQAA